MVGRHIDCSTRTESAVQLRARAAQKRRDNLDTGSPAQLGSYRPYVRDPAMTGQIVSSGKRSKRPWHQDDFDSLMIIGAIQFRLNRQT